MFTQLVWKASTEILCSKCESNNDMRNRRKRAEITGFPDNQLYALCLYRKGGNFPLSSAAFKENVLLPTHEEGGSGGSLRGQGSGKKTKTKKDTVDNAVSLILGTSFALISIGTIGIIVSAVYVGLFL